MEDALLLLAAGLLAGAMNALAGGGSFVTLPALVGVGLPSVVANATSTVALFPGGLAGAWIWRDSLVHVAGISLKTLATSTVAGGLAGSLLLLLTPSSVFDQLLPWLLLIATATLASGRRVGRALRDRYHASPAVTLALQFLLGLYGGYFGGAVGLMMLAVWSILDGADFKTLNGTRIVMVSAANLAAVLCFVFAGIVSWWACLALGIGAVAGGWIGAHGGKRLPAPFVQAGTLVLACVTTVVFFARAYLG